jgi:hypothetical protein
MTAPIALAPVEPVGTEMAEDLVGHEARSDARVLLGALFDAWDLGNGPAFADCFAAGGTWVDADGRTSLGHDELIAHLHDAVDADPASVHWLGNEDVRADPDGTYVGSWLWTSASRTDDRVMVWSGGDLSARLVATDRGLRIAELVTGVRYRTPEGVGWLHAEVVEVPAPGARGRRASALAGVGAGAPPLPRRAPDDVRARRVIEESRVRWAVLEHADLAEAPGPIERLADHFLDDAVCILGPTGEAHGREAIRSALAADLAATRAWIRPSSDLVVRFGEAADEVAVRWRDLWTAEADGAARWMAHVYDGVLHDTRDGWRFARLERTRILDRPYGGEPTP